MERCGSPSGGRPQTKIKARFTKENDQKLANCCKIKARFTNENDQKLVKSCKIKARFTKEICQNSKCPYLLNKNVSEALNTFFVVSIFGLFFIVWGPKGKSCLKLPCFTKENDQKLVKSCKIKARFTKEISYNSKCPYLLNKNVSEALDTFFVVSIFGLIFIVGVPKASHTWNSG